MQNDFQGMDALEHSHTPGGVKSFLADRNYEEVPIEYSANSAEVETAGVRINLIPQEGSNQI